MGCIIGSLALYSMYVFYYILRYSFFFFGCFGGNLCVCQNPVQVFNIDFTILSLLNALGLYVRCILMFKYYFLRDLILLQKAEGSFVFFFFFFCSYMQRIFLIWELFRRKSYLGFFERIELTLRSDWYN